jgi:hypothetical protein
MASLNVIRTLTVRSTQEGVTETAAALKGLQSAHDGVAAAATRTATVTDAASKRQLSIAEAYRRQTLALDDAAKAQDRIRRSTAVADRALQQGVITQNEYASRLDLIRTRYAGATAANDNFTKSAGLAKHEMVNLSRQVQDIGVSLSSGQSPFTVLVQQGTQVADIFSNSQGSIRGFASQITSVLTPVRLLAGGVALLGVAAVAAIVSWRSFALQLDDTARQAGITSSEMAKLQAAASFRGIGNEDSAKAFGGFSRAIYDAKNNMGGLAEVFIANNMRAGDFNKSLEQSADLIKNAASDQQRLVLLQQMGLPATMQWVRFMSQGAEGIRKAKEEATAFGGAANDNMVAKAREFDEALNKMTTNFGMRWRGALVDVAGFFDQLSDKATAALMRIPGIGKKVPVNLLRQQMENSLLDDPSGRGLRGKTDFGDFYGAFGKTFTAPGSGKVTVDPDALKQQLSLEQQRIGILGQLASVEDQVRSREIEIATARLNGVKVTKEQEQTILGLARAQADGTLAMRAQADALRIEADVIGLSVGKATELRMVREKEAEAARLGISVSAQTKAAWKAEATAAGEAAQALEKKRVAQQIKNDRATMFLSAEDIQIANQLKGLYGDDIPAALASSEAAAMRFTNALKMGVDLVKDVALELAKVALAGGHMGDALVASLDKVAGKLLDKAFQDAMTALATMDPMMAAKAGAEAAIAVGISLFTGDQKKQKAEQEALEKAQEAWNGMKDEFEKFSRDMRGDVIGGTQQGVDDARDRALDLYRAAVKAEDFAGAQRALDDFTIGAGRMVTEFQNQVGHVINLMNEGMGIDSPLMQAFQKAVDVAQQLKGFVSDAVQYSAVASQARQAAQGFALSLLDLPKEFSATEKAIMTIRGTALALNQVLVDLGMSSADAAKAIDEKVIASLKQLAASFTDDLQRQLNELSGKGFINELNDLIKKTAQTRSDAALLPNVDTSLIDRLFSAQAQKIVDEAADAGIALAEIIGFFPQLSGVVHDATESLERQAEAQRELDRAARSIVDYVSDLQAGPNSTLSPSARLAAAQATYNAILPLAQGGDADALGRITQDFENLRKAAQDMFGSSSGYQSILSSGISQLLALPAVANSTDPVVAAVQDVVAAVLGTTAAIGGTTTAIGGTTSAVSSTKASVDAGNVTLAAANTKLGTANTIGVEQSDLLVAIRGLQTTSTAQLQFLTSTVTSSVNVQTGAGNQVRSSTNNLIQALNKVAINTYAIAQNTYSSVEIANNSFPRSLGTLASGGWIKGGTPGRDSVLLGSGNTLGMPGEFVVTHDIAQKNAWWLPTFNETGRVPIEPFVAPSVSRSRIVAGNDNSEVVAELRRLYARIERLEERLVNAETSSAIHVREGVDEVRESMEGVKRTANMRR